MIYSFLCGFHSKGYPRSRNWTLDFEPAFSPRFSPTFHFPAHDPFFTLVSGFLNHVTSLSPRFLFSHWSAVSPSKPRDFRLHEPAILFSYWSAVSHPKNHVIALGSRNWTLDLEPAFSPRFSPTLSPRSIFPTRQRFPLPNHVTSGCMSPRSLFQTGQRFPLPNHVTSGSRHFRFR